jgi:hypothetical protein
MRQLIALTLAAGLIGAVGCESKSGTAPSTNPNKPDETRKLTVTVSGDHTITQGETDDVMVAVTRSHHKDDVTLEVSDLPTGVTLDSKDMTVPGDKSSVTIRLKADATAPPVSNHVFHIVGKAKDLTSEVLNVKLTVKAKR